MMFAQITPALPVGSPRGHADEAVVAVVDRTPAPSSGTKSNFLRRIRKDLRISQRSTAELDTDERPIIPTSDRPFLPTDDGRPAVPAPGMSLAPRWR